MASPLRAAGRLVRDVWTHPANRHRRVRAVLRLVHWQVVKRILGGPMDIAFHGMRLTCYPDSPATSAAIYFNGLPDYWEMQFLRHYLQPGDNFIDVGANVGMYSILAASRVGRDAVIDAFEPMEPAATRLEQQARRNGLHRMRVHRRAVGEREGPLDFGFAGNDAQMHLRRAGEAAGAGDSVRVAGVRLDTFEPYADYAAGKMDIEGAEPLALAGARERLRHCNPPVWLIEFAGYTTHYGVAGHEFVEQLARAQLDCAVYDPASRRITYTETPWRLQVQNVLLIARSHRAFVEARVAAAPSDPS